MSRSPSFAQLGRGLFLSFVLVTFAAPAAFSQTSTGSIRGYVKDASGAPLGGAAIEARNEQSGVSRTTNSQPDGSYALPGLVPGAYNLTTRHIGHTAQGRRVAVQIGASLLRSEEHTSELQSQSNLVCRLLLEKKKHITHPPSRHY